MKTTQQGAVRAGRRAEQRTEAELGFTMIEVLVGLALLAGITLGIMAFVDASIRLNKLALQRSIATGLCVERIEALQAERFHPELDGDGDTTPDVTAGYQLPGETTSISSRDVTEAPALGTVWTHQYVAAAGTIPGYEEYSRTTRLTYGYPLAAIMRAEVTVTWTNLNQGEKSHQLVTFLHPSIEQAQ
ncbi:MAG: hypothetical protein AAF533_08215 [Acidobacteriota bacterium]